MATASVLSGGRVALGLGAGWMREEFDLHGQDFDNRGPRLDEMIQALRALWKGGWVEWRGTFYEIPPLMMEPHPESRVPIYCGGHSDAALRRGRPVLRRLDRPVLRLDEAAHSRFAQLKRFLDEFGRGHDSFEIIVGLYGEPGPRPVPARGREARRHRAAVYAVGRVRACRRGRSSPDQHGREESAERYRRAINRFAEQIVARC